VIVKNFKPLVAVRGVASLEYGVNRLGDALVQDGAGQLGALALGRPGQVHPCEQKGD
jgi:hypothetical protein